MITTTLCITARPEKRTELTQAIASLAPRISQEKGCIRCDSCMSRMDQNRICLMQEWESFQDYETHQQSDTYKILIGAITLLGADSHRQVGVNAGMSDTRNPVSKETPKTGASGHGKKSGKRPGST